MIGELQKILNHFDEFTMRRDLGVYWFQGKIAGDDRRHQSCNQSLVEGVERFAANHLPKQGVTMNKDEILTPSGGILKPKLTTGRLSKSEFEERLEVVLRTYPRIEINFVMGAYTIRDLTTQRWAESNRLEEALAAFMHSHMKREG